jgi:hypothetical protein
MGDRVRIGTCANPAEATLLRSLFAAHDIPVAIGGEEHASMMGGLGSFITLDISVAAEDAERASELLADFKSAAPIDQHDDDEEDDEDYKDDIGNRLERRKRIGVAIALAFMITLGTAHLSAGALKRALALAAIEIYGFTLLAHRGPWPSAALIGGAILYDAIGSVMLLRKRFSRQLPAARMRPEK